MQNATLVISMVLMQVVSIGVIVGVVHNMLADIRERLDKLEKWNLSQEKRMSKRDG